jgi:hypothetical protein
MTDPTNDDDDTRTAEQHMADVAAYTLERLARLDEELDALRGQLEHLSDWADRHHKHDHAELLSDTADAVGILGCCVPDAVRDIAATLHDAAQPRRRHLAAAKHQPAQHNPTGES